MEKKITKRYVTVCFSRNKVGCKVIISQQKWEMILKPAFLLTLLQIKVKVILTHRYLIICKITFCSTIQTNLL